MKKLYCFDFDGTLTKEDTLFLFLKFCSPKHYFFQYCKFIPLFVLVRLKLAPAGQVKKMFISALLKGKTKDKLEKLSNDFFKAQFPDLIRENALHFLENIAKENTKFIMATASLDIWVKPFADHFNMTLVATKTEVVNGIFTGNFIGENCNGKEKLRRIKEEISTEKFDKIIAFGDTSGDKEMLSWANEGHYRFFH